MQFVANMTVVALPKISSNLNFSAETLLWVNLIYLMSFVAFSLPFAKIISQYGVKKCTKLSLYLLLISIILSVLSMNYIMFLISRLIQGFTSASLAISLYVMIVEEFEDSEIGSYWKLGFLILIPIIAILLIMINKIDDEWTTEKRPVDKKGSLIYILIMIILTYGITELDESGAILIVISLVLMILFIKVERNVSEPIFNFKLAKNIKYLIGNYAALVTYFTTTIALTLLSLHLQYVLNIKELVVGLILIIPPIIMILIAGWAGKLSNSIDPRLISGIAMMFLCTSSVIFFFLDFIDFKIILIGCALQGIGNGLFSAPNNKYVLTLVEEKDLPNASSVLSTSKEFGKILSSGIFTLILSVFVGNQRLGPDKLDSLLVQSTNLMMFICILVTFSATVLLFYSKFKYEHAPNEGTVNFFKRIAAEWVKKRMKD